MKELIDKERRSKLKEQLGTYRYTTKVIKLTDLNLWLDKRIAELDKKKKGKYGIQFTEIMGSIDALQELKKIIKGDLN